VVAGASYAENSVRPKFFFSGSPLFQFHTSEYYTSGYIYSQLKDARHNLNVTLGLTADSLRQGFIGFQPPTPLERNEVNPKLGLIWTPPTGTTVRAAAFQTTKRPLIANQTIEPTQIAGFNQLFDDVTGSIVWTYGLGLDQAIDHATRIGFELSERDLKVPAPLPGSTQLSDFNWKERNGLLYFYHSTPRNPQRALLGNTSWTFDAQYVYEELIRSPGAETGFEGFAPLKTQLVPIGITLFPVEYWSIRLAATYITQSGSLQSSFDPERTSIGGSYWIADLGVAIRLPGRKGQVTFGISNLFDEKLVGYQDTDTLNPLFTRSRFAFARVTLQFY